MNFQREWVAAGELGVFYDRSTADMYYLIDDSEKFEVLEKEDPSTRRHRPRSKDPKFIASVLKNKPIKMSGFCGMCDTQVNWDWFLKATKPFYELRHLADDGTLRPSELDILITALESGELDNYWEESAPEIVSVGNNQNSIIANVVHVTKNALSLLNSFIKKIPIFCAKKSWRISRNGNLYNPVCEPQFTLGEKAGMLQDIMFTMKDSFQKMQLWKRLFKCG